MQKCEFPHSYKVSDKTLCLEQIIQELKDLEATEIRRSLTGVLFMNDSFNEIGEFSDEELLKRLHFAFVQSGNFYGLAYKEALKIKELNIQTYAKELFLTAAAGYKAGGLRGAVRLLYIPAWHHWCLINALIL